MIQGCNIFWGQKLQNTCIFLGGSIIMQQQKKILRPECSWTNQLNTLQEAINYSFIKFTYCFSIWYKFFVHYAFGISVSLAERMSHQTHSEICRFVLGSWQSTRSRLPNNFVKKIFVCIGHCDNVLGRCVSIFPSLRCQGVWNKTCTQLSFPNLSESEELQSLGCSKILLSFMM